MNLKFEKWTATGNDFILIDLRDFENDRTLQTFSKRRPDLASAFCRRKQSLGADGLIFLLKGKNSDVEWDFYNADGSTAEMCGNAARCVGAYELRRSGKLSVSLLTSSGTVVARKSGSSDIAVQLQLPKTNVEKHLVRIEGELPLEGAWINSGVPHFVVPLPELQQLPQASFSRRLRNDVSFGEGGANITYITQVGRVNHVVTYERGVEDYTQACGTGAVAAAFFLNLSSKTPGETRSLQMPGGDLTVSFIENHAILTGNARQICVGQLTKEAM